MLKQEFWKWSSVALIGLAVGCYSAFVAECFWNWFAVPILHFSSVSFFQMLGILLLIQVVTSRPSNGEDHRWVKVLSLVELCVPQEKQKELAELKEPEPILEFLEGFSLVLGKIGSDTFLLLIGFALHLFV